MCSGMPPKPLFFNCLRGELNRDRTECKLLKTVVFTRRGAFQPIEASLITWFWVALGASVSCTMLEQLFARENA